MIPIEELEFLMQSAIESNLANKYKLHYCHTILINTAYSVLHLTNCKQNLLAMEKELNNSLF